MNIWIGRAGSGKTTELLTCIKKGLEDGKRRQIWLVPELASHDCERALAKATHNRGSAGAEVLTFRRIANRVFSEAGGLADQSLTPAGRLMVLYESVQRTQGVLSVYAGAQRRPEVLKDLLGVMDELKCASVSPETLLSASEESEGTLSDKLRDLGQIFSVYESMTADEIPDPRDELTRVRERLPQSTLFDRADVYLDGFDNFNRQELDILTWLMGHGVHLTVTLTGDRREPERFPESMAALARLRAAAGRAGQPVVLRDFGGCRMEKPHDLRILEQCGLQPGVSAVPSDGKSVRLHAAGDIYSECEYAAAAIRRIIRETGARRRDFVVTAREFSTYAPVVEQVFARYDLPVFLSEKHDILQKPVLALVTNALRTLTGGWRYEDIFSYLKTGFASLEPDECDILENYVDFRRIRGSMWQKEWKGNPGRFSGVMSEEERAQLEQLNALRERVIAPLNALQEALNTAKTALNYVQAVYDFLEAVGAPQRIEQRAQAQEDAGRLQTAEEYRQLWDILTEALEQIAWVRGEAEMETEVFVALLRMVLSEYDVGTIPIAMDRVTCGSIDRVCRTGIPHLIVLGVNDGVLPAAGGAGGILTDSERGELLGLEIELETGEDRLMRENSAIYRVLASARTSLLLSWMTVGADGEMRPSYLIGSVRRLLDGVPLTRESELDSVYRLEASRPRFELACRARGGDRTPAALAALRELGDRTPEQTAGKRRGPLNNKETVRGLYGEKIRLTASRLDSFSRCRFAYFVRYGLRAQERRRAAFDAPESGTFLHYVLEHVLKEVLGPNGEWRGVSREAVRTSAEAWTKEYVEAFLGGMENHSERFRYLFRRLVRTLDRILDNLMEELACSEFRPLDFELSFSGHGDLPAIVMEGEYGQLELVGKVDRVDGYIKDNRLYVRVMDYKSGTKKFELSDLWYGLNMQLMIYLFAVKDSAAARYRNKLKTQFDSIETAGALYVPTKESVVSAPRGIDDQALHDMREKLLRRSGLLLDDPEVLEAMEHGMEGDGRFLPVGVKKDGTWKAASRSSLASMEQLGKLYRHMQKTLKGMGQELLEGSVEAEPIVQGKQNTACTWCPYAAVCQYDETLGDHGRPAYQRPAAEVWESLEQSGKEGTR
ncbi:MAG: exodeoxyribonuclease V subunit gamma [Eubacteriales bacterium]|nr:exodeoxyribonuclease V subunit gamma [Eubacteriales bacterium]